MKEKEEHPASVYSVFFPPKKILHFFNRSRSEGGVMAQTHIKTQIFVEL